MNTYLILMYLKIILIRVVRNIFCLNKNTVSMSLSTTAKMRILSICIEQQSINNSYYCYQVVVESNKNPLLRYFRLIGYMK